jgi:hypothetical protein
MFITHRFTQKIKDSALLLVALSLWCSLPVAGWAARSPSPPNLPISGAIAAAPPAYPQSNAYYNNVLSTRNYNNFGIINNSNRRRPYVTAFYYPWYNDTSANWGTVTPETVPAPLNAGIDSFPWLTSRATKVFEAPVIGIYDSAREHILEMHLNWARNSGINALLVSEAGKGEVVLQAMKRLNSPVKYIPLIEWAVLSETRDPNNMAHVKQDLKVKFTALWNATRPPQQDATQPSQPYYQNYLTYGNDAKTALPVVYIYARALLGTWPKGTIPTRQQLNASRAQYLEAYAQVLKELSEEPTPQKFIVIADLPVTTEGITKKTLRSDPGPVDSYSMQEYYSDILSPACLVFDGFLPYHKNFRLSQAIRERNEQNPNDPFDNSKNVLVHTQEELTNLKNNLVLDTRQAKDYLTGDGIRLNRGLVSEVHVMRPYPASKKICGFTVKPGFYDVTADPPDVPLQLDRQDGIIYKHFWDALIETVPASEAFPGIVAITSFNEHFEGSGIEPTVGTDNIYLKLTRAKALQFQDQPSVRLDRDVYYNSDAILKMRRWGAPQPQDVPRYDSDNSFINLTALLNWLNGKMWIFNESNAKSNYEQTYTSVNPIHFPRTDGIGFIKAGVNNWHLGLVLKDLIGSSNPSQFLSVRRQAGGDERIGIFFNHNRTENATIPITAVNRPFDVQLAFRAENRDVYRPGSATFDVSYSANPALKTQITVNFVPLDERISLANGRHIKPYLADQRTPPPENKLIFSPRAAWGGTKGIDWYHRFDGRRRIEAFVGTHHLVIFLTGPAQAVIDGRCVPLPRLPFFQNGHWFVHEDVFLPL